MIAEMATGIEAARLLTQKSAWMIDNVLFHIHLLTIVSLKIFIYIVTYMFNFCLFVIFIFLINLGKEKHIYGFNG